MKLVQSTRHPGYTAPGSAASQPLYTVAIVSIDVTPTPRHRAIHVNAEVRGYAAHCCGAAESGLEPRLCCELHAIRAPVGPHSSHSVTPRGGCTAPEGQDPDGLGTFVTRM
jgi:hypothetical protein